MSKPRLLSYSEAIHEALDQMLSKDSRIFVIGEGVPDPKGVFGTTIGLQKKYGSNRIMDMPLSENALTGVTIGAAIRGLRPVLVHQRVDFSLLSFDQLINIAAKWFFMFGGQTPVPLVVRMIIGRGWGQGGMHSQSLQALFVHIPGLKVIMPATAYDAKGLLIAAINDNNPVIFLEHRWLHNLTSHVPKKIYSIPFGLSSILHTGIDVTIIATSYCAIESLAVAKMLKTAGISVEVINLRSLKPLDDATIFASVAKTGRLLVVDTSWISYGVTGEIISRVVAKLFDKLKTAPLRLGLPDVTIPTSPWLTKNLYPGKLEIARLVYKLVGKDPQAASSYIADNMNQPPDVPDNTFKGPF